MLKNEQKKALLSLAHTVINDTLYKRSFDYPCDDDVLRQKSGAFVTIKIHGELRGCIGYIDAVAPLWDTVLLMAKQAAFHDPRFYPLTLNELPDIAIEISVISPMQLVTNLTDIEVGRDGLMIISEGRSGLLLPQVATEYGWDRETFLCHTCRKAGLSDDAYLLPHTKILRFEAEVFGDGA